MQGDGKREERREWSSVNRRGGDSLREAWRMAGDRTEQGESGEEGKDAVTCSDMPWRLLGTGGDSWSDMERHGVTARRAACRESPVETGGLRESGMVVEIGGRSDEWGREREGKKSDGWRGGRNDPGAVIENGKDNERIKRGGRVGGGGNGSSREREMHPMGAIGTYSGMMESQYACPGAWLDGSMARWLHGSMADIGIGMGEWPPRYICTERI
jgi:hypothetical protein